MVIWVVTAEHGQYSDYSKWVVGVANSLAEAERIAISDRVESFTTAPIKEPDTVEPGVTEVTLGYRQGDWDEIEYSAEAFEIQGE